MWHSSKSPVHKRRNRPIHQCSVFSVYMLLFGFCFLEWSTILISLCDWHVHVIVNQFSQLLQGLLSNSKNIEKPTSQIRFCFVACYSRVDYIIYQKKNYSKNKSEVHQYPPSEYAVFFFSFFFYINNFLFVELA